MSLYINLNEIIMDYKAETIEGFIEGNDFATHEIMYLIDDLKDYYRSDDVERVRELFIEDYFDEDFTIDLNDGC